MCLGGSNTGDDGSAELRQREAEREARIAQGMGSIDQTFSQFDDNFYNKRAQAYDDYALPQVEDQYSNALGTLTAALARSGMTQSSVAADKSARLSKDYSLQRQGVVDQGIAVANDARHDVENSRAALVSDLYATADPAAAAAAAAARAKIATSQPSFSPLGLLFQNAAAGLADYNEAHSYNQAFAGGPGGGGAYGSTNSGKVIR